MFKVDVSETQREYMDFHLKKPTRMPIRNFATRSGTMSRQIKYLPCLDDACPENRDITAMNREYTQFELANLILRACKQEWQDEYFKMNKGMVPTNVKELLVTLEGIETLGDFNSNKNGKRKHEKLAADKGGYKIPKKEHKFKQRRVEKFCGRCKAQGGPYQTLGSELLIWVTARICSNIHSNSNS